MQKQSIKQKHFQVLSACVQASNHYLQKGSTTTSSSMKTSTLVCLEAALVHFEPSGRTLCSVAVTCKYKDLTRSPVWKYSGAFWENSLCKDWWGTLAMTQRSLQACQLVSVQLKSAPQNFYRCADTHSNTGWHEFPASLQTSTPFLNILLDMQCVRSSP